MHPVVTRMRSFSVTAMMFGLALAVWSVDRASAQTYAERVDVSVIQIPVSVARNGTPVTGLTRDDFEVFVNGDLQPIAYFDVLEFSSGARPASRPSADPSSAAVAVPPPSPLTQRRLTLLLFDVAHSTFDRMLRARADAQAFVSRADPSDYFAVAVYQNGGVRYLVPFTGDREAVRRAIATLSRTDERDALSLAMTPDERARVAGAPLPRAGVNAAAAAEARNAATFVDYMIATQKPRVAGPRTSSGPELQDLEEMRIALENRNNAESWTRALGKAAATLRPLEGIKQVLIFTDGHAIDVDREDPHSFAASVKRLHGEFRAAGVVLNVIDIGGLRAPDPAYSSSFVMSPAPTTISSGPSSDGSRIPSILHDAALDTGGQVASGSGIAASLGRIFGSRRVTYLIGIKPPASERENNSITVKVKGQPALTEVYYRRGYTRAGAGREVNGLLLADVMMNDIGRDDVTVRVAARDGATLNISIPSAELLSHASNDSVAIDLFVYVFDSSGGVAGWSYKRVLLDEKMAREQLGPLYERTEKFILTPGRYTARVLVHVLGRDVLGFTRTEFVVASDGKPAAGDDRPKGAAAAAPGD